MRRLRELAMYRDTAHERLLQAKYRAAGLDLVGWNERDLGGSFKVPSGQNALRVLAGVGSGWDHLSISVIGMPRVPNWAEMELVKRLFFKPDETAMQLHVPPADHVNQHEYVLHLWRPHDVAIPRPPAWMV